MSGRDLILEEVSGEIDWDVEVIRFDQDRKTYTLRYRDGSEVEIAAEVLIEMQFTTVIRFP